ncbi:hypothetical protein TKK_0002264 [Trichogramma kaykai]
MVITTLVLSKLQKDCNWCRLQRLPPLLGLKLYNSIRRKPNYYKYPQSKLPINNTTLTQCRQQQQQQQHQQQSKYNLFSYRSHRHMLKPPRPHQVENPHGLHEQRPPSNLTFITH